MISENADSRALKKEVLSIAVPAMLESLMTTMTSIIDSKMVSTLGTKAISAVAVTNQPKLFLFAFFFAVSTVTSSKVAFYRGKNDREGGNRHFLSALLLTGIASLFISLLAVLAARPILKLCSGQKDTLDMSIQYFRIIIGGMVFNHLFCCINAGLRGCGFTKVTFLSNAVSCVVNIVFNYFLIGGNCGFPKLGIAGAAIATVVGTIAALIFSIVYLFRSGGFLSLDFCRRNKVHPDSSTFNDQLALLKHVVTENLMTRIGFLISSSITARIGSFAMSVYAVGMHLLDVDFAIGNGFQVSSVALIGRSRGEGRTDKIDHYSKTLLRRSAVFSAAISALILLFSKPYFGFFSTDAEFIRTGVRIGYIIAVIAPIQITKLVYTGLLQGLGEMKRTMKVAAISVTGTQIVCNIIFTILLSWGIFGIMVSSLITQGTWLTLSRFHYLKAMEQLKTQTPK